MSHNLLIVEDDLAMAQLLVAGLTAAGTSRGPCTPVKQRWRCSSTTTWRP
jgi:hypothetical protein